MDTTFLKEAKNTPSRKLPDSVKNNFTDRGYHEANDARVHLDDVNTRAMNSIAFTYGNDIFVQNNYANNENVLSHEMGHVVQQMRVGVSPDSASTLINSSSSMENQANEIAFGDLDISSGGSAGKSVQRLMSLEEFQASTKTIFGKRDKMPEIESALAEYNAYVDKMPSYAKELIQHPEVVVNTLKSMLEKLYNKCNEYKSTRIIPLRIQIAEEEVIFNQILQIHQKSQEIFGQREYKTETLDETQVKNRNGMSQGEVIQKRYFVTDCKHKVLDKYPNIEFCKKLKPVFDAYFTNNRGLIDSVDVEAYTNAYQNFFSYAIHDENAPEALKTVLEETMEFAPRVSVSVQGLRFANKYRKGSTREQQGQQYDLSFMMGTDDNAETISSYLHELTHINVGESYGNTSVFLGLCENDDYGALFQERVGSLKKLTAVIKKEIALAKKNKSPFTVEQLNDKILWKLSYGAGDEISKPTDNNKVYTTYIDGAVKRNNAGPDAKEGISMEKGKEIKEKIKGAMGNESGIEKGTKEATDYFGINSNVFVEYDAVINQLLMWCYSWGIPKSNPVVVVINELVQREYDRRKEARAKRGVDLKNINKRN